MKWISVKEEFPRNGDMVCVKIPKKDPFICIYKDDSFGLGDLDFKVTQWRLMGPHDLERHCYSLQSISRVLGHTDVDSSELHLRLA